LHECVFSANISHNSKFPHIKPHALDTPMSLRLASSQSTSAAFAREIFIISNNSRPLRFWALPHKFFLAENV
jgi:hypothetical protein